MSNTRIAKVKWNDISNGYNVCVSIFVQGCPHRCQGCWNPETWDFNGGEPTPDNFMEQLLAGINHLGISRNLNILGGEPLCEQNKRFVFEIIQQVRQTYPAITIYLWTGYTIEYLKALKDECINNILYNIDILIDGPYQENKRDLSLELRGSSNQRILAKGKDF